jgi:hypothetical protein
MICTPAMVYLVLAVIYILYMIFDKFSMKNIVIEVIIVGVWTWFLNFLCSKGHTGISWFLVVLPYLFIIFLIFMMGHYIDKLKNENMTSQGKMMMM